MFARSIALLGAAAVVSGRTTINDQAVVDEINAKNPLWKAGEAARSTRSTARDVYRWLQ